MSARPGQFALPLDWSSGGSNDGPLIVGASNADAVRYLRHVATWPVRSAVLTGPRGSGRSLMGRLFARETGGRVIDGHDSVSEEEIFHAWNAAQSSGTPLLLIADAPPSEWGIRCVNPGEVMAPFALVHEPKPVRGGYALAGHIHPAVRLSGGAGESLRLPCFWFGPRVGVLPSFGAFTGSAVVRLR